MMPRHSFFSLSSRARLCHSFSLSSRDAYRSSSHSSSIFESSCKFFVRMVDRLMTDESFGRSSKRSRIRAGVGVRKSVPADSAPPVCATTADAASPASTSRRLAARASEAALRTTPCTLPIRSTTESPAPRVSERVVGRTRLVQMQTIELEHGVVEYWVDRHIVALSEYVLHGNIYGTNVRESPWSDEALVDSR